MSANSKIEWTDHTFNPVKGCTKVSPGCAHCYAERYDQRHLVEKVSHWGKGAPRLLASEAMWREPLKWNRAAHLCDLCGESYPEPVECLCSGQRVATRRARVFCASHADWLDEEWPIEVLARLLALIHATPNLDWLLLTKRPENWLDRMTDALGTLDEFHSGHPLFDFRCWLNQWIFNLTSRTVGSTGAPANVWIGTTVEDQVRADERIPALLAIPARVRFLSCEPLLGPVDIAAGLPIERHVTGDAGIDWVIAGGESGPGARPMHPQCARDLRDQCAGAGVPFLFKQWGEWLPGEEHFTGPEWKFQDESIVDSHFFPADLTNGTAQGWDYDLESTVVWRRVGKHAAGRLLDGIEHHAFPNGALTGGGGAQ
jgi:protein gp37